MSATSPLLAAEVQALNIVANALGIPAARLWLRSSNGSKHS